MEKDVYWILTDTVFSQIDAWSKRGQILILFIYLFIYLLNLITHLDDQQPKNK